MENTPTAGIPDVVHQLKQILIQDLQLNLTPDEIPDDYSLLDDGLALDSILIEELIARIEDRFELRFDDRVLEERLFTNLSMLATFVWREWSAQSSKGEARA